MINPKRLGLFSTNQRRQPFAVFENDTWRVWISYNPDVSSGTYLQLHATGSVDQVTVLDGDVINIVKIM